MCAPEPCASADARAAGGAAGAAVGVLGALLFVLLNGALNLYMKWLFLPDGGDFALPWTMLAVQQAQAYLVLQPLLTWTYPAGKCGWRCPAVPGVFGVTVFFCLNVGLNSLSLVRISITLNQTVRAFLPIGVLLLGKCVEQHTYTKSSYLSSLAIVAGIVLTCWGNHEFERWGVCLALASTLVAAMGASLNARLLNGGLLEDHSGPEKILWLMTCQTVPAFFLFSSAAALLEGQQLCALLADPGGPWRWYERLLLLSVSSTLALLTNLSRFFLVATSSALAETSAGNAKVAVLCAVDHFLFGTQLLAHNCLGILVTFGGFSMHMLVQHTGGAPCLGPHKSSVLALGGSLEGPEEGEEGTPGGREGAAARPGERIPSLLSSAETGLASELLALRIQRVPTEYWRMADEEDGEPEEM